MSKAATIHSVEFGVGCHIAKAAQMLVAAAKEHGAAVGTFNDFRLEADANSTVEGVVANFDALREAAAEAYRKSPEGTAAAREAVERAERLQAKHDSLVSEIPSLDFTNDIAVLDWLCAMQDPSDHIDVKVRRDTILSAFTKAGFKAGVNCGSDYRADDRDNTHRWIVGQALDGLEHIAIHGIIHKFVAEWKAKFVSDAPRDRPRDDGTAVDPDGEPGA